MTIHNSQSLCLHSISLSSDTRQRESSCLQLPRLHLLARMAGRRMPHNNRVSSSTALRTNDIWSKTIGHNPYKNDEDDEDEEAQTVQSAGLMLLAKMTNVSGSETRGGCSKCGMMGHLRFQCRNTIQLAKPTADDDSSSSSSSDEEEEVKEAVRSSENWGTKLEASKEREVGRDSERGRDESSRGNKRSRVERSRSRSRSRSRDHDADKKSSKKHKKQKSENKEKKHKEKKRKSKDDKKEHKSKKSR